MSLHGHDATKDVGPGDLRVGDVEPEPLDQTRALQLGEGVGVGDLLVEDELVLLLGVVELPVDDVRGEGEAVDDHVLVGHVEVLGQLARGGEVGRGQREVGHPLAHLAPLLRLNAEEEVGEAIVVAELELDKSG